MKFYESGDQSKPVIFLFPGTCCLYTSFDHVLENVFLLKIYHAIIFLQVFYLFFVYVKI